MIVKLQFSEMLRKKHRGAIIMVARFLRTARNAIPYKKTVSFQQVSNMLFVFETAAARRGGSEEPRYQFPANISPN